MYSILTFLHLVSRQNERFWPINMPILDKIPAILAVIFNMSVSFDYNLSVFTKVVDNVLACELVQQSHHASLIISAVVSFH